MHDVKRSHAQGEQGSMGKNGVIAGSDVENRSSSKSKRHLSELPAQRNDKNEIGRNNPSRDNLQSKINEDEELPIDGSFSVPYVLGWL